MNSEIKAIILDLGNYASNDKPQRDEHNVIIPFSLHYIDANLLFGYICELEEQIKNQKEIIKKQSKVIIPKNIEQHNEIVDLNVRIKELEEENKNLKDKIEKAKLAVASCDWNNKFVLEVVDALGAGEENEPR